MGNVVSIQRIMRRLKLLAIRIDGGTQTRIGIDDVVVDDYLQKMHDGVDFPPVIVFFDGVDNWLADGFHRVAASKAGDYVDISADVRPGTRRDALLYSVGANSEHGKPRTNEDKRCAVRALLADPEWAAWSDREIANRCHVDHKMVARLRSENSTGAQRQLIETRKGADGRTRHMPKPRPAPAPSSSTLGDLIDSAPDDDVFTNASLKDLRDEVPKGLSEGDALARRMGFDTTRRVPERSNVDKDLHENVKRLLRLGWTGGPIAKELDEPVHRVGGLLEYYRIKKRVNILYRPTLDVESLAMNVLMWANQFDDLFKEPSQDDIEGLLEALKMNKSNSDKLIKKLLSCEKRTK